MFLYFNAVVSLSKEIHTESDSENQLSSFDVVVFSTQFLRSLTMNGFCDRREASWNKLDALFFEFSPEVNDCLSSSKLLASRLPLLGFLQLILS